MLTKSAEEAVAQAHGIIPELTLGRAVVRAAQPDPSLDDGIFLKTLGSPVFPERGEMAGTDTVRLLADHPVSVSPDGSSGRATHTLIGQARPPATGSAPPGFAGRAASCVHGCR